MDISFLKTLAICKAQGKSIQLKRKSDNIAGLWDKVEKKFYASKTSTPLVAP